MATSETRPGARAAGSGASRSGAERRCSGCRLPVVWAAHEDIGDFELSMKKLSVALA
jgi:hypothetical protein